MASAYFFFFFNDPPPPEIYPLPLHDALPISDAVLRSDSQRGGAGHHVRRRDHDRRSGQYHHRRRPRRSRRARAPADRKSTRLNSSHGYNSYAVFCLKKKKHLLSYTPPLEHMR